MLDRIRGASIYPAVQNIILACRALGLGTVITTNHLRIEAEFTRRGPRAFPPSRYIRIDAAGLAEWPLRPGQSPTARRSRFTLPTRWSHGLAVLHLPWAFVLDMIALEQGARAETADKSERLSAMAWRTPSVITQGY